MFTKENISYTEYLFIICLFKDRIFTSLVLSLEKIGLTFAEIKNVEIF